ncbi:MAG TPA: lytic transglycosylase domain-containing protein [Acidimicrobiales bacterium]|nr:lytic transglycosylase domain-containing protein [Acidimicrobiales bacterium]
MRRRTALLALALVAACSSGDDDAAPTTVTTTTVATTVTTGATTTTTEVDLDAAPVAATDPAGLAAQIEAAHAAIADAATSEAGLAAAGHLQQVAYRALAAQPEWDAEVEAALPDSLHAAVDANVEAGRQLRALVRNPRPHLPAWRIIEPEPPAVLRAHYEAAEAEFGVRWQYLAAVHLTETRMGRIRGTSTAGAQGPMQFLPSTWEAYGEGDINDTGDAIRAAARYLHANGAPGDMDNALYRYNPTEKYVIAVKAYAGQMIEDERAFLGYYHWQVYYWSTLGDVWLRVGYEETEERPVTPADLD